MKWTYENKIFNHNSTNYEGFVYKILEKSTGMIYVGKKSFFSGIKESDWKTYKTSSKILKEKIKLNPEDYEGVIIEFGKTTKQLTFLEAKWQNHFEVMNSNNGYNKNYFN